MFSGRRTARHPGRPRFANFHDPSVELLPIKEERDCHAVSLIPGVDRFAVAQADRPPRQGDAREQPTIERVRLLIPGHMSSVSVIFDLVYNHAGGGFGDHSLL